MAEHTEPGPGTPPVVQEIVTLPVEIDVRNADWVTSELCEALRPGVTVLIADMSLTEFCDSSGVRSIVIAHDRAIRNDAEFRLVIPSAGVLRVLSVLGLDGCCRSTPAWVSRSPVSRAALRTRR